MATCLLHFAVTGGDQNESRISTHISWKCCLFFEIPYTHHRLSKDNFWRGSGSKRKVIWSISRFHYNPAISCWDVSVLTKVLERLTLEVCHFHYCRACLFYLKYKSIRELMWDHCRYVLTRLSTLICSFFTNTPEGGLHAAWTTSIVLLIKHCPTYSYLTCCTC